MRYLRPLLWMAIPFCLVTACRDEIERPCGVLTEGLLHADADAISAEVDEWLTAYAPAPTPADPIGHEANLLAWIDALGTDCDWSVSLGCYACIETLPVQSHVNIQLDSAGTSVIRILDILTPEQGYMTLREIHL